jgi:hypothetical protein
MRTRAERRAALRRAKARLDTLQLYRRPVRIGLVQVVVAPWAFRWMPPLRRFDGYATHLVILMRRDVWDDDLLTHELCHVWQMQHHPLRMPLSYVLRGYARNPYEAEARRAVDLTR